MNNVLFTSDILLDTDYGLLKYIKRYCSNEYFNNLDFIDNNYAMKYKINEMDSNNPLDMILKEEYKPNSNDLYDSFMGENYDDIVKLSMFTDVIKMANVYNLSSSIDITIICKSLSEKQIIREKIKCDILVDKNYNCDVDIYDAIVTKSFNNVKNFLPVFGKNIYIGNIKRNLENGQANVPLIEITDLVKQSNNLYLIDIYNLDKPKG